MHIKLYCVLLNMGRWDSGKGVGFPRIGRNYVKIAKYVIATGFVIVAVVVLLVFIPRSGLNVEIVERSEVMGTMQTVSVRISNNNFDTLNGVSVQFGEQGQIQQIGNMGPFASAMITPPESAELNFTKVTVTANGGDIQVV